MQSKSQASPECVFRIEVRCVHPAIGGDADDLRCAVCPKYRGKMRGLGDAVHSALSAVGIAQAVDAASKALGTGCGCSERRAALNAAVPFTDDSGKAAP